MDPKEIIARAKQGDRLAKQALVRRLEPRITQLACCYARRTGMDSADLVQEAWIGMLQGLVVVNINLGDPEAYLRKRAKWAILEAIRKSARAACDSLDDAVVSEAADPDQIFTARWLMSTTRGRLSPIQIQIYDELCKGHKQVETAKALGCTAANVSYHVKKIREALRELTEEQNRR